MLTEEDTTIILEELALHGDMAVACMVAGVDPAIAEQACLADPQLALAFRRQVAKKQSVALSKIHAAISEGDVHSAKWLLERVSEKYAPPKQRSEVDLVTNARKMTDEELYKLAGFTPAELTSGHGEDQDHQDDAGAAGAEAAPSAPAAQLPDPAGEPPAAAPEAAPEPDSAEPADAGPEGGDWGLAWAAPGGAPQGASAPPGDRQSRLRGIL